jgi:hypothetical protein
MKFTKFTVAIEVILILAATVSLMFVVGCGTTQLTNLWKDSSYNAPPLKKILVIAMRKDQLNRRMWEDAFVTALKEDHAGTVAVPSYQLFPQDVPEPPAVQEKAKEDGFDGVLIVARIERDSLKTDIPGYTSTEPVTEYSHKWGAYLTHYENVYHPGYTETQSVVSVRTDLLVTQEEGQLIWSATSKEIDPSSPDQFRSSVSDLVMDKLAKEGLVK